MWECLSTFGACRRTRQLIDYLFFLIGDTRLKDELVKVLFNHFEVLSILFAPSHMMPLFGLGLQNGLVLDIGYNSASVIPVYQGVPMLR